MSDRFGNEVVGVRKADLVDLLTAYVSDEPVDETTLLRIIRTARGES